MLDDNLWVLKIAKAAFGNASLVNLTGDLRS